MPPTILSSFPLRMQFPTVAALGEYPRWTARMNLREASAEHFEQRAEFLPLRNRGLGPLSVAVLPVPFARRATATARAAVQSTAPVPPSLLAQADEVIE